MRRFILQVACLSCLVSFLHLADAEFSSKTTYSYYNAKQFNLTDSELLRFDAGKFAFPKDDVSTCKLLKLDVVYRHGSRNPSDKGLKRANKIIEQVEKHKAELKVAPNGFDPRTLTVPQGGGRDLLTEIASPEFDYLADYVDALLKVDNRSCANVALDWRSSNVSRSIESGQLLINFLCNNPNFSEPILDNRLLRFFDFCDRYVREVDDNESATAEVDRFTETSEFQGVLSAMNKTFAEAGFNFSGWLDRQMDRDDVQLFYELCSLDIANATSTIRSSPSWCALVRDHLTVIDYYMDMDYYYSNAHAYPINYQSACGFFEWTLNGIKSQSSETKPTMSLLFGHLETVVPVITLYDLIDRSEHLTVANFKTLGTSRNFRVERLSPFAANLALVTMGCGTETRVYHMLNERLVVPNYCKGSEPKKYCSIQEVEGYYRKSCPAPVEKLCAISSTASTQKASFLVLPTLLVLIFTALRGSNFLRI